MRVPYVDFPAQFASERKLLLAVIDHSLAGGAWILGEEVESFESNLARHCSTRFAIGVANGTDALVLSLKALGIGPGDEVLTVPNSFVATAASIALVGARPVFVDVRHDQLMDPSLLERLVTRRTKAIIPVHLTGKICDMAPILAFAKERGLPVVEDAAQALGAKYRGRPAGSFGRLAAFSFHPLKNLNAAGDAGAIVTDDPALAEKLSLLRNHGLQSRDKALFWGHNSRLDAVQAAILNFRLGNLSKIVARRREIARLYRQALAGVVECPEDGRGSFDTYHLFVIQTDRRDELQSFLKKRGISTAIHYPLPIHLQPAAANLGYRPGDLPEAERQAGRILSLPVHQHLKPSQVEHVAQSILRFYRGKG